MKEKALNTIYTIGHSNQPVETFIDMLRQQSVQLLADIRSFPGSRYCPQFNKEQMKTSLAAAHIEYIHMPELGGRRKTRADSINTGWKNLSFRGYADYMETDAFKTGMAELQQIARQKTVAYMCSEVVWWRCHRSLVSDYLKIRGWTVIHIMPGKIQEHPYTSPAKIVNGELSYAAGEDDLFTALL
jgi:uncharacterized protein (DUF488 family)